MRIWVLVLVLSAVLIGKTGLQCQPNDAPICHDIAQMSAPARSTAPVDTPALQPVSITLQTPISMIMPVTADVFNELPAFRPALYPPPPR